MDSLEIHVDRGNGVYRFLAIYRVTDQQVGQWSDVSSMSVMN